jgi:hypothetical protein
MLLAKLQLTIVMICCIFGLFSAPFESFENRFPTQRTFDYVLSPNLEHAIVLDMNHKAKSLTDCGKICGNNPNCNLFMVKSEVCVTYTVTIPANENASSISYHPPQDDQFAFFDAGKTTMLCGIHLPPSPPDNL